MIKPVEPIRPGPPARATEAERRTSSPEPPLAPAAVVDFSEFVLARESRRRNRGGAERRRPRGEPDATPPPVTSQDEETVGRLVHQLLGFPPVAAIAQANSSSDRVFALLRAQP